MSNRKMGKLNIMFDLINDFKRKNSMKEDIKIIFRLVITGCM